MATLLAPVASVPLAEVDGMTWSDRFLLGYTAMDDTHREFVEHVAALERGSDSELPTLLAQFSQHAVEHFAQEECWMNSTAFPAAQCHADEHAAVLRSVHEVEQMLRDGATVTIVRHLTRALIDWFPAHADYMDAALSHWMSKRTHGGLPVVLRRGLTSTSRDSSL